MSTREIPTIVGNSGAAGFVPLVPKDGYGSMPNPNQVDAAKAGYISIARHDLLAPVRRILTLTDFLSQDLGVVPADESREHVQKIRSQAEQLTGLLDALDQFERAHISEASELVPLGHIMDTAVEAAQIPAGITVIFDTSRIYSEDSETEGVGELDAGLGGLDNVELYAERRALFSCVVELVKNAVVHRRQAHGSIRIEIDITETMINIVVEDDGAGIAPEHRSVIFEPLRKIHVDETVGGNGMGLTIARRIADSRGGSVELVYSTSHGSSFRLSLPTAS